MIRDEIRAATLGQPAQFKSEVIEIEGKQIEVRQPSVGDRHGIAEKSIKKNANDAMVDLQEMRLQAIIHCCFVPGTGERIFDPSDYDALRSYPAGSWVDKIGDLAVKMLYIETGPQSKNSETTESDNGNSQ